MLSCWGISLVSDGKQRRGGRLSIKCAEPRRTFVCPDQVCIHRFGR